MSRYEEAGWNEEIHEFLLAYIFRGSHDSQQGLLEFSRWLLVSYVLDKMP